MAFTYIENKRKRIDNLQENNSSYTITSGNNLISLFEQSFDKKINKIKIFFVLKISFRKKKKKTGRVIL